MRAPGPDELKAMVEAAERPTKPASKGHRLKKPSPAAHISGLTDSISRLPGFAEISSAASAAQLEHTEELRRFREESKRLAAAESAHAQDLLAGEARAWDALVDDRAPEPDGIAPWEPERTPVLFVRTSPGGSLHDFGIVDGDNWAKWEARASGDAIATKATVKVSFFHLWQNPRRRRTMADITVGLTANGSLSAEAEGMGFPASLFWPDSRSEVTMTARLTVWPLWVPDTSQPYQSVSLASVSASGGTFSDSSGTGVAQGTQLQAVAIAVPRGDSLLIEASIVAEFYCYSGDAEADFASDASFRVRCPYCIVAS